MKIVVLDGYAMNPGDLSWEGLESLGRTTIYERTAPGQLMERAAGAEVLLTNKTVIRAEHIEALPALRYIGVLATGYNVVDVDACRRRGIVLTNIPAYSTASVAQMAFAHLLAHTNRVEHYADEVRRGDWTRCRDFSYWDTPLVELSGLTMGLVGLGHTGMATARLALAFGMKVKAFTSKSPAQLPPDIEPCALDDLFRTSDVVSLHCPLTSQTHHLVDARRLALMKPTAYLINTGRGPLVDEQALADALHGGRLAGAGVDVLSSEPPRADNPLLSAPRCHITPHIAWATLAARRRLMDTALSNLRAFLSGSPVNNVAE